MNSNPLLIFPFWESTKSLLVWPNNSEADVVGASFSWSSPSTSSQGESAVQLPVLDVSTQGTSKSFVGSGCALATHIKKHKRRTTGLTTRNETSINEYVYSFGLLDHQCWNPFSENYSSGTRRLEPIVWNSSFRRIPGKGNQSINHKKSLWLLHNAFHVYSIT